MLDLGAASIADLQGALAAGEFTSVDLVKAYLARIEEVNNEVRAVLSVSSVALQEAARLDEERKAGKIRSEFLHGIPLLFKDNISTRCQDGMDTTAGSYALKGVKVPDARVVSLLRAAGAIILGKLNLSEWSQFRDAASLPGGWSAIGGQTTNPYFKDGDPSRSSSGCGVAAALALAAATIGTENQGSIIAPASICNVVGLRVTVGLISRSGIVPLTSEKDTVGPIARTVADAAALLTHMTGTDASDPYTMGQPDKHLDYTASLRPDALKGKRLGIPLNHLSGWGSTNWEEADIYAPKEYMWPAFEKAVNILRSLGAEVIDVDIERCELLEDKVSNKFAKACEFKHSINEYLGSLSDCKVRSLSEIVQFIKDTPEERPVSYESQAELENAEHLPGLDSLKYLEAKAKVMEAKIVIDACLAKNKLDAFIMPGIRAGGSSRAGYPQITVPLGFAPSDCVPRKVQDHLHQTYWNFPGQPFGITFAGTAYSEAQLLAFAYAFEQATHYRKQGMPYKEATPTTRVGRGQEE